MRELDRYIAIPDISVNPTKPDSPELVPIELGQNPKEHTVRRNSRGRSARELAQTKGFRAEYLRVSGVLEATARKRHTIRRKTGRTG